ncbi:gamma-glutamylcyclotransferase [Metamycoplasma phocicerebrale]|uniref:Gamma-glutamylcyclotransferase n=1 Tax=Metamycoplasma phocicerebrale TaxID=142649 RepID=A0A3T0TT55_9BACT|nr:gamma-glutamylcyclotransferase family protein [Metamycoplasma phocicerebrale]AZZ65203.1 gamma-glutamylcyclotransferase [Metamycoplasma phocicerebrale]
MNNQKIYVFAYASIQDPLFYENLLSNWKTKRPAVLNGYAKCIDSESNLLIKKDNSNKINGFVFEITKEELFMLDRWNKFPHYQRHIVNVMALDTNEMIENVQIYTKLEFGQVYLAPEDEPTLTTIYRNENEMNSFIEIEKLNKNFPIIDNAILYKVNEEQFNKIKNLKHPYLVLIIEDVVKKNYLFEHYAMIPLELKNEKFALMISFGQNKNLNSKFYYDAWENKDFNTSINILWKPLYEFDASFLAKSTPYKYINLRWDLTRKLPLFGAYNDKSFEYLVLDFDIDPLKRLNTLIEIIKKHSI